MIVQPDDGRAERAERQAVARMYGRRQRPILRARAEVTTAEQHG